MSVVTNIIVTASLLENAVKIENGINACMAHAALVSVDQLVEGSKCMECRVWIAACNHIDHDRFSDACRSLCFNSSVQVFIRKDGDDAFSVFCDHSMCRAWCPEEI